MKPLLSTCQISNKFRETAEPLMVWPSVSIDTESQCITDKGSSTLACSQINRNLAFKSWFSSDLIRGWRKNVHSFHSEAFTEFQEALSSLNWLFTPFSKGLYWCEKRLMKDHRCYLKITYKWFPQVISVQEKKKIEVMLHHQIFFKPKLVLIDAELRRI